MAKKPNREKIIIIPAKYSPIGKAARNIKKGESIRYSPFINTKDILVNINKPSISEIEAAIKTLQNLIKFEHARGSTCITTTLCDRLKEAN